jgi:hypothetical protein
MSTPIDTLMHAQDELLARLLDGRITAARLPAAYRLHVAQLTAAGFAEHEAAACFWDAVHTARHTLEAVNREGRAA